MTLQIAEEHGLVYLIKLANKPELPSSYVRKNQLLESIQKHVLKQISGFNGDKFLDFDQITLAFFNLLIEAKLITHRQTPVAGDYYKYDPTNYQNFRANFLKSNDIHKLASEIGDRYYRDAFAALEARIANGAPEVEVDIPDPSNHSEGEGPNPRALSTDASKAKFVGKAETQLKAVEQSQLSNADKSTARGYLIAAKALADTPEPPVDIIWTILQRANSVAGIASFFVALVALLLTVGT